MSIVAGLQSLGEGAISDPREFQDFHRPEIERLFGLALEAKLPRTRELKHYEPLRLNERHLAMVMLRAGGIKQREIAQAFGATDANVSIILNHPDAELLLTKLQAMKAGQPSKIEQRLRALSEPALGVLEELFHGEEVPALKKAPAAFKLLELNGYGAKKQVEHNHQHQLRADPVQLARLTDALKESRAIEQGQIVEISTLSHPEGPPGGEPALAVLSPEAAAPSSGGSQEDLPTFGGENGD